MSSLPTDIIPLESDPEIFTSFSRKLGLSNQYQFYDIVSTDTNLLSYLLRPVRSIILLFHFNDFFQEIKNDISIKCDRFLGPIFFKQKISNACGLYAILHSLINNHDLLVENSVLGEFLTNNGDISVTYDDSTMDGFLINIINLYNTMSTHGETQIPTQNNSINLHFVTFIEHKGYVYELDGRNLCGPINLGTCEANHDLLDNPCIKDRIQWYIDHTNEEMKIKLNLLGLCQTIY